MAAIELTFPRFWRNHSPERLHPSQSKVYPVNLWFFIRSRALFRGR